MHQAISAFTRDSTPIATPDDVAETLRYFASDRFAEQAARWKREDIAWHSGALFLEAQHPGFFEFQSDTSAREIMAQPAIVWG